MPSSGQVDPLGAVGQASHQREVAQVVAHHLDDKAPARGHRGLLDLVDVGDDAVQRCVAANGQLRPRQVIIDRHRQADDRQVQRPGTGGGRSAARAPRRTRSTTSHQQPVDVMPGEVLGDLREVGLGGHPWCRAQRRRSRPGH
jgi:hypothetical protein